MSAHRTSRFSVFAACCVIVGMAAGMFPLHSVAGQTEDITVVASGLTNPRGFAWGADGTMYIGLAGDGVVVDTSAASTPAEPEATPADDAPVVEGAGETYVGTDTASVARIENGCAVAVASGFPSGGLPDIGWVLGVDDVEIFNGQLYALVGGGGEAYGHADAPNGVYQVNADGSTVLIADLSAWFRANPVAEPHDPVSPDAQPFAMVAGEDTLWIVEANHQQVLTVALDGTITRIADLSVLGNLAPAGIALSPDGGVYVGFLSPVPFVDGSARVVHVAADGTVTDVWTGLTAVTSIAVDGDGNLYALEMTTNNTAEAPFVVPGSGKVVRQAGPDTSEEVITGLSFPVKMEFGPDGALYVGYPAFGATNGEGAVLSFDLSAGNAIDASGVSIPASACSA